MGVCFRSQKSVNVQKPVKLHFCFQGQGKDAHKHTLNMADVLQQLKEMFLMVYFSGSEELSSSPTRTDFPVPAPLQQPVHEAALADGLCGVDEAGLRETHAGSKTVTFKTL